MLKAMDDWVTAERVKNYSLLLIGAYLITIAWMLLNAKNGLDAFGEPLGNDFLAFYAASDLARAGQAAAAYDPDTMFLAQQAALPASRSFYPWLYPPTYQVLVAPLAYLPHGLALSAWIGVTLGVFLVMVRQISDHRWRLLLALAFPAVLINGLNGQNGFLTAGLLGLGLLMLDRRPWVAGLLLGLLAYKPHFGLLLPPLLMVSGRWRSFVGAAISVLVLIGASLALYGIEPWRAFFTNFDLLSALIENRALPQNKAPSVFGATRLLGAETPVAHAIHALFVLPMIVLTLWAWRRAGPLNLKIALAVPTILAASPYSYDYDLVMLALPIGILADYRLRFGAPTGTAAVLLLAFVTPVAFTALAGITHLQLMPVAIGLLYLTAWRVLAFAKTRAASQPAGSS